MKLKPLLKPLLFILKLALTGYILWLIFAQIALGEVLQSIVSLPVGLVILLGLLSVLRHLLQYQNWHYSLLLNPMFRDSKSNVVISYFAGLALRFLVPGGASSVGKVLFLDNSSRYASLSSFGAERGFMTWVTWVFALGAGLFFYSGNMLIWISIGFVIIALAPLWAYWLLGLFAKTRQIKPGYRLRAPRLTLLQVVSALIMYLQYWLILQQSGAISFGGTLTRMSLTNFSNSIPITFAGLGLRESFAIHFLADAGFTATQAVTTTLTVFVFQDVMPGIVGAVTLLVAKKKPRQIGSDGSIGSHHFSGI